MIFQTKTFIRYEILPTILRYVTLCYITLRYVALHFVTLHYVTLHYVANAMPRRIARAFFPKYPLASIERVPFREEDYLTSEPCKKISFPFAPRCIFLRSSGPGGAGHFRTRSESSWLALVLLIVITRTQANTHREMPVETRREARAARKRDVWREIACTRAAISLRYCFSASHWTITHVREEKRRKR